jgi:hypothetical protein
LVGIPSHVVFPFLWESAHLNFERNNPLKQFKMKQLSLFALLMFGFGAFAQDCTIVEAQMNTQIWASEISWNVIDDNGLVVYQNLEQYANYSEYLEVLCLEDGCYNVQMFDSFGDGWNGATLDITVNGNVNTYQLITGEYNILPLNVNSADSCGTGSLVWGCTDPNALNYNPDANVNDGSCTYPVLGCTDPEALNYNPWATIDDGSCDYPVVCDSGQVMVDVYICVFSNGQNVGFELADDQGNILIDEDGYNNLAISHTTLCLDYGTCYTITAENLVGPEGWYGGYFWVNTMGGNQLITGELQDGQELATFDFSVDGTCGELYGCTDPNADNYNPDATIDDGSCYTAAANDLCADAEPLSPGIITVDNSGAVVNEDIWGECWSFGSGEGEQTSVWYSFTTPDYPAHIVLEAIGDGTYTLTDTQFGLFAECGGEMIYCDGNSGDGLLSMFDFPCGELEENTEYILMIDGYYGDSGTCLLNYSVSDDCSDPVYGCTDPNALNYNPSANVDDGSCYYEVDSCEYNSIGLFFYAGSFGSEVSFDISDEFGNVVASFEGFQSQNTYYFNVCLVDGCYSVNLYDSWGDGWNGGALDIIIDGVVLLQGLTIPDGFEGSAMFGVNTDDCDFEYELYGCTDPAALNYNPLATIDDGTCYYDTTEYICQASFEIVSIDEENDVVYIENTSYSDVEVFYFWDWGDGTFSEGEFPTHTYAEAGLYTICLYIESEFCWDSYCDTIFYDPEGLIGDGTVDGMVVMTGWTVNVIDESSVGVAEFEEFNDFSLYPSPANDIVYIRYEGSSNTILQLSIRDLQGRIVAMSAESQQVGNNLYELNVSNLSNGSYFIEALSDGYRSVRQFEVMR